MGRKGHLRSLQGEGLVTGGSVDQLLSGPEQASLAVPLGLSLLIPVGADTPLLSPGAMGSGATGLASDLPHHQTPCQDGPSDPLTLFLCLHREVGKTGLQLPQDKLWLHPLWAGAAVEEPGTR